MKSEDSHWSAQENRSFPLSFAQQRLWFLDQWQPGSAVYNIPGAFRLTGPLHIVALEQSLNEIIRRHAVLRTCFSTKEGQPVQVISPFQPLALPISLPVLLLPSSHYRFSIPTLRSGSVNVYRGICSRGNLLIGRNSLKALLLSSNFLPIDHVLQFKLSREHSNLLFYRRCSLPHSKR